MKEQNIRRTKKAIKENIENFIQFIQDNEIIYSHTNKYFGIHYKYEYINNIDREEIIIKCTQTPVDRNSILLVKNYQ